MLPRDLGGRVEQMAEDEGERRGMRDEPHELVPYGAGPGRAGWSEGPAQPDDDAEILLRRYAAVLRKRWGVVAGVVLAAFVAAAAANHAMVPVYTATVVVQIEREAPHVANVQEVQRVDPSAQTWDRYDYYETQFQILQSRTVAARVVKQLSLDTDLRFVGDPAAARGGGSLLERMLVPFDPHEEPAPEPARELGLDSDIITRYLAMLSVEPIIRSRLVKVKFTTPYRELSAEVANEHVRQYVETGLQQRLEATFAAQAFLEEQVARTKGRVDAAESALNAFRKEHGILSVGGDKSDLVVERLGDLNARVTAAQDERIRLEARRRLIERGEPESLPDVVENPVVVELKSRLAAVETERAELARRFGPAYPKLAETRAREKELRGLLAAEIGKIAAGVEAAYRTAREREEALGAQLEAQRDAGLAQKDAGADYQTLARDVESSRQVYTSLLARLKDLDVAAGIKVSNVSVVDWASAPRTRSAPRTKRNLFVGALAGLLLGIGAAFFLEKLDNTIATPDDVEALLGLPTLGVVPAFGAPPPGPLGLRFRSRDALTSGELPVLESPSSAVAEAYRSVRTAILVSSADRAMQVVLLTSVQSGDGKTVTAVNLALVLAQAGGRVLLIDADLRRPRIHRLLDLANGAGLSTHLTSQVPLDESIHAVPFSRDGRTRGFPAGHLDVLPSGPGVPNPAELLGSRRMRETLDYLRTQYDYVLIDTSPALPVSDPRLLAGLADGVALVVRGHRTRHPDARRCRDTLDQARARILGVVLNGVDVSRGEYARYYRDVHLYYAAAQPEGERAAGSASPTA